MQFYKHHSLASMVPVSSITALHSQREHSTSINVNLPVYEILHQLQQHYLLHHTGIHCRTSQVCTQRDHVVSLSSKFQIPPVQTWYAVHLPVVILEFPKLSQVIIIAEVPVILHITCEPIRPWIIPASADSKIRQHCYRSITISCL